MFVTQAALRICKNVSVRLAAREGVQRPSCPPAFNHPSKNERRRIERIAKVVISLERRLASTILKLESYQATTLQRCPPLPARQGYRI
jgi:hypothetical protein